jgi:methyl coenzyme M reductase beta subunit
MNINNDNEMPWGARFFPGVDLRLWLALLAASCVAGLLAAAIVVIG